MRTKGMWVSPTEFVQFGESSKSLSDQIATRGRSIDFHALGMYLPNPDPVLKALGKDIKVYRELRADAHVGGCIRRRKAAVKALEWGLDRDKAKSRVAKSIEAIFADLDLSRIITEMLDAVLYGYQPMEVMWGKVGGYLVPVDVIGKPADWFLYSPDNELRFRSRQAQLQGEELPPRKFLVPRQDPSYHNPYGFADLSMCFWPVTFKKGGLRYWVKFAEKYGMPAAQADGPRIFVEALGAHDDERIRQEIAQLHLGFLDSSALPHTTVSIGLSMHVPGEMYSATLDRADSALRNAKSAGRNRIEVS